MAEGTGTPDPQPQRFSELASLIHIQWYTSALHFPELVIWGSKWGREFRFHRLSNASARSITH